MEESQFEMSLKMENTNNFLNMSVTLLLFTVHKVDIIFIFMQLNLFFGFNLKIIAK